MATKNQPAVDMSSALGDLTKMLEQFKLPGVDMKEILESRRKDIDALVQANQAILEGMQALANKQGELLRQSMEDTQSSLKAAMGGVGVADPAKQGELARKACEKALGDMKDLAEIARQSQADALAKIAQRANESAEEIKKSLRLK